MTYWLDLFTGTTWNEFRKAGANVSGFRERRSSTVKQIQPGDILLCYLTGVMLWVGALKVIGPSRDTRKIWGLDDFPERLDVQPLILLDPEIGVPMQALEGKVDFYSDTSARHKFKGFLRGSPNKFRREEDGALILELLNEAKKHPVVRSVDQGKLERIPLYKVTQRRKTGKETLVSVPGEEDEEEVTAVEPGQHEMEIETATSVHLEIQYRLLRLGAEMGLDVWVARNDRSKVFEGKTLGSHPRMVSELPTQFNEATQKTIELIDVLWLKGNSILAAFEIESTTSIYSGLLRMSDLLALQPNLDIKLYLLAADERRNKVRQEILRPTFELRQKPLSKICGFIPFSTLIEKVAGIEKLGVASALTPGFLETTAEYFTHSD